MSCPTPDRVLDYLARRLDTAARDAIDAHVDACPSCRVLLGELAQPGVDEIVAIGRESDPDVVGRYRVEARIGDGGMGTVYAAYDPQLERRVALKLVHPELAASGGLERLLREGRALAKLSHPNVVGIHDAGADGDQVYIAMELIEGETLAAWLRSTRRTWREILDKFVAVGRGLAAAHRSGIVHRDVKPENVLLDRDGVAKVADFGLAGHSERRAMATTAPDPTSRLTHPGAVMGTPAYMSPEQRRGDEVGPLTDQYSLCAVMWSALFDESPHRRIPRWLRRALARGMAPDPRARFASIEALVATLDPAARARRARRWTVGGVAAVVVLGAGVLVWTTRREDATGAACAAAAGDRANLWSGSDRRAIAATIHATKVPYADDTWKLVDVAATEYVQSIAKAEATLCDQRPQSPDARTILELGLACLGERRAELAALTGQLRDTTAGEVRYAVSHVHDLASVEECTNTASLSAERAASATPELTAARGEVSQAIRAATSARSSGKFKEAVAHARRAVERARPIGGAILTKALIKLGDCVSLVEGSPAGEAANREAITVAEAAHADDLRAVAMANLMEALAREPGREREALAFQPLVEAAVMRSGKQTALMPTVQLAVGIADLRLGQTQLAVERLQAALASARAVLPRGDPRMPEYVYPVGVALGALRKDAEALEYFDEAYRVAIAVWGEGHPNTARFMINLATKHAALGDCDKALGELAHARSILTGALPLDSPEHLQIGQAMGACYYVKHAYDDALREYTARQQALLAAGRANSAEMAGSWVDVGDVQLDRTNYDAAAASYRRSIAGYEELLGNTDARLGLPLARLGEAELAAGHLARAVEPLERAIAIYTAAEAPPVTAADVAFPLARALWSRPADRKRARSLAESARDAYLAGGPAFVRRKDAVVAWLRGHAK